MGTGQDLRDENHVAHPSRDDTPSRAELGRRRREEFGRPQQRAIDGADAALNVYVPFHDADAAKYVTETDQPAIFAIMEVSQKWFDSLPKDLQQIVQEDAASESAKINPWALDFRHKMQKEWVAQGGELIHLPPDEQAQMMKTLASVGEDVSKGNPLLHEAYKTIVASAKRTAPGPGE
jgi:TRAP-type C4-dicarboxylate transport system substrate-binding protein